MTVSYNWLKDYLKFDLPPAEVEKILTSTGLEVEQMKHVEQIPGGLAGVVVAEVVECFDHPDSDHLHVTKVNTGAPDLLQVVCGAPNVTAGQKVLLATVGTTLPNEDGSGFKIKKSKIRGVESYGMICAEDELGIGTDHDGIMVLEPEAVVGTAARDYLRLKTDTIFEIGLTPNRIDGASHIGVARDLYAYCKLRNIPVEFTLPSVEGFSKGEGKSIPVRVEAPDLAPRYIGITISGVKVGPSPDWLKERLMMIGQRPINNIVDITNFLLNENGHPLHVFDAAKIVGGEVVVRRSTPNCKFVTLDGVERTLSSEDLVICNAKNPMCIAGVFGGEDSGVTETTTDIFLESAYFNPTSIRKTSKRHGLKTDASFRYERGVDPLNTMYAAKRAAMLITEVAGGCIVGEIQESYPKKFHELQVELNYARMESFIGKKIETQTIKDILVSLDFYIRNESETGCLVDVPSYRVDVTRECDVVEEILRIYGYNNVELPLSMKVGINSTPSPDPEALRSRISDFLANNGFVETMNNSLTKSDYYSKLKTYPADKLVKLLNPLSHDLDCMRQTLIFNALEVVVYNLNRQTTDLKIFEMGNVYSYVPKEDEEDPASNLKSYREEMRISMAITGHGTKSWRNETGRGHYFALKGYLELLLKRLGCNIYDLDTDAAPSDLFSEGLEYRLQSKQVAVLGVIQPALARYYGIKQPVFVVEIRWNAIMELLKRNKIRYKELPRYPEVRRDLALLLDENVTFAELRKCAFQTEKALLRQVTLFDVYRGDKIPSDKKQYALGFTLQHPDQTLTDADVEKAVDKLYKAFQTQFGAVLR